MLRRRSTLDLQSDNYDYLASGALSAAELCVDATNPYFARLQHPETVQGTRDSVGIDSVDEFRSVGMGGAASSGPLARAPLARSFAGRPARTFAVGRCEL